VIRTWGRAGVREPRRRPSPSRREAEAGFAITTYDQRTIEGNALERFGPKWGDPEDLRKAMGDGWVDANGAITQAGWDQLIEDINQIERNAMAWMKGTFTDARDEGHQHDDLVGTFWFDPADYEQARLVELASDIGRHERIDMVDASYGDLADSAMNGVSDFGASVLGGHITFFDVKPEDMEALTVTLERRAHGRLRPAQRKRATQRKSAVPRKRTTKRKRGR
jgi:hypothetical protein